MIAVWLVVPPSRVASPITRVGSSPAVSAGARSSASSTDGTSGVGTPGSPWPVSSATIRSRTSRTSVTRSAISPPSAVNMSTNCCAAATVATAAGAPASIRCSTAESSPRSRASPAVVESTSALTPVAAAARSASRSATTLGRGDEALLLRGPVALGHLGGVALGQPDGAGRPDHGTEGDSGHDGRAGQHDGAGGRGERRRRWCSTSGPHCGRRRGGRLTDAGA